MFVRKKKINGKEYYYLVKSRRNEKNIERYIGLNPPTKQDMKLFEEEYNSTQLFLLKKKDTLSEIKEAYKNKLRKASKDELAKLEEHIITEFTYNTSRIEGSALTLKDTNLLLNLGISPNKSIRDIKEVENHKKAYQFLKEYKRDIDMELILTLHRILKKDITEDAGAIRHAGVMVGDMIGLNHRLISTEINNLLSWYRKNKTLHPIELISQFHCIFERIHPFFDGNGRVGRLLMNHTLARKGYPPVIMQNKNKKRYYNALIKGQNGNYLLMIKYIISEMEAMSGIFME